MRAAADEDRGVAVAMENRLYPMRELLGDLLLDMGQQAAALTEYEAALKASPNRTGTVRSGEPPARRTRPAIAPKQPSITASSRSCRRMPIPSGRKPGRQRHSWRRDE
jgi:hypothetical protein